jgi:hypothetical protein
MAEIKKPKRVSYDEQILSYLNKMKRKKVDVSSFKTKLGETKYQMIFRDGSQLPIIRESIEYCINRAKSFEKLLIHALTERGKDMKAYERYLNKRNNETIKDNLRMNYLIQREPHDMLFENVELEKVESNINKSD